MVNGLKQINLSVVELAELCRTGDIHYRFSSRSSAQEGIAAHRLVQDNRPDSYKAEHSVSHEIVYGQYRFKVCGRMDGYMETSSGFCVDEIKSIRIPPEDIPECVLEHFWRQAGFYAFLLGIEEDLSNIRVRLCLYHLDEEKEYRIERTHLIADLRFSFIQAIAKIVDRLERRDDWRQVRSSANSNLGFPYKNFRPGQRDMAVSVFRQLKSGGQVVIQAPTGIGKTIGMIFPAIHALESSESERVFYLSARSSTQQIAESAAEDLVKTGGRLRTLTLTAKAKICFNKTLPCDPEHCQFARGYYDRVRVAIDDMLAQQDQFDRKSIERFAQKYAVCPFELGLDLSFEMDLIICDYNYVFDPTIYLRRYFDSAKQDSIVLVDEAHNLIDRGRDMFSAEINKSEFSELASQLDGRSPALYCSLRSVVQLFLGVSKTDKEFESKSYLVYQQLPEDMLKALRNLRSEIEVVLTQQGDYVWPEDMLDVYYRVERFIRTAAEYNDDYVTFLNRSEEGFFKLKLFCVDPAKRLASGFARIAGVACFSATLQPRSYFRDMLGITDEEHWYQLKSPFPKENLHVSIASFIDTSFRSRESSIDPIVRVIETITASKAGSYIVFFPSYKYLELVYETFIKTYPNKKVVRERQSMGDEERQIFLKNFNGESVCGFAVMSGAFSEGIDLKGKRLIGAIVIGVGLPGVGIERDLIRHRYADKGFEIAYQYPGMIRVLQTAGRVIRSDRDEGVICLVDSRYRQARYKQLLPEHWRLNYSQSVSDLKLDLVKFWESR